jgi:hypothetical protein
MKPEIVKYGICNGKLGNLGSLERRHTGILSATTRRGRISSHQMSNKHTNIATRLEESTTRTLHWCQPGRGCGTVCMQSAIRLASTKPRDSWEEGRWCDRSVVSCRMEVHNQRLLESIYVARTSKYSDVLAENFGTL